MALGHRLDIVFYLLRIGLFYMDSDLITRNSEKAKRYVLPLKASLLSLRCVNSFYLVAVSLKREETGTGGTV